MAFLTRNRIQQCIVGAIIAVMLFGCASTKETSFNQKYQASKSWFKEKWKTVDSKFSSPEDEEAAVKLQPNKNKYYEHRVKWYGESLSLIAGWYTGRYGNWKAIAEANPGLNPNRIAVGDIIYIPPELMKTKKPLPRKVVSKTLPGYFAHTVTRSDEKFTTIIRWYTGNVENRSTIAKANPDIDPEFLLVGDEIYIPSSLLKTRKSMFGRSDPPSNAKTVEKSLGTAEDTAAQSAAKPKKIQLFGPKQFPAD
jgi:hypothetical protein